MVYCGGFLVGVFDVVCLLSVGDDIVVCILSMGIEFVSGR